MLMLWKKYRSLDFEYAQDNGLNVIRSCLNFFTYHRWRIEGFSCHSLCFLKIIHNLVYFQLSIILPLCHHFPLGIIMIISFASLLHALITSSTQFYLTPFLYGIIYLHKLLPALLSLYLSIIPCHFFHNVHVLWVHCRISNLLLCTPLHSCINFHRKKRKKGYWTRLTVND